MIASSASSHHAAACLVLAAACSGKDAMTGTADGGVRDDGAIPVDASLTSDADATPDLNDAQPNGSAEAGADAGTLTTFDDVFGSARLYGVTDDGYVIYLDGDSNVCAVSLSGGPPAQLTPVGFNAPVIVQSNVVLIYPFQDADGIGPLVAWSSAGGLHQLSAASTSAVWRSVSADSADILYLDHATADTDAGTGRVNGDLYVANVDGSRVTLLRGGISQYWDDQAPCYFNFYFAGSYAVLSQCTPVTDTDAGSQQQTVSTWTFPAQDWQPIELPAYRAGFVYANAVDRSGAWLMLSTSAGLQLYPVAGGAPRTVDPTGYWGEFSGDGQSIVYTTSGGALVRTPVAYSSPQTLVTSDILGLLALSPDDRHALVYETLSQTGQTALYLASATMPSLPSAVLMTATGESADGTMLGDAFTTDSSHVIAWSNVDPSTGTGTLVAEATSGSSNATELASRSNAAWAVGGASVVFSANTSNAHVFDIEWMDTSQTAAARKLVAGAIGFYFYVSPARDRIIYLAPAAGGSAVHAGIFTLALP